MECYKNKNSDSEAGIGNRVSNYILEDSENSIYKFLQILNKTLTYVDLG